MLLQLEEQCFDQCHLEGPENSHFVQDSLHETRVTSVLDFIDTIFYEHNIIRGNRRISNALIS